MKQIIDQSGGKHLPLSIDTEMNNCLVYTTQETKQMSLFL